jgi:hypothetical protein
MNNLHSDLIERFFWGRYLYGGGGNAGDAAQTIGLDMLYRYMGIPSEKIIDIDPSSYRGDKVICPIYGYLFPEYCEKIPISPDVIPVFIGTALPSVREFDVYEEWIKMGGQDIILCRDKATTILCNKYGYNAQFFGCLSLLIPKRENTPANGKIYFCDIDWVPSIERYIPDAIKSDMVDFGSQIIVKDGYFSLSLKERILSEYKFMQERERYLADTAKLVITSRLHMALPCVAMGIPVIKISSQWESRLSLVDSFIPSYRASEFPKINWNPSAPDIEHIKEQMFEIAGDTMIAACNRFLERHNIITKIKKMQNTSLNKISHHYQFPDPYFGYVRPNSFIYSPENFGTQSFFKRLTNKFPKNTNLIFWGAGENAVHLLFSLGKLIKSCNSFTLVDNDSSRWNTDFFGYLINPPQQILQYEKESLVIFITPFGASEGIAESIATTLETEFNMCEGIHFFSWEYIIYSCIQNCFEFPRIYITESLIKKGSIISWRSKNATE